MAPRLTSRGHGYRLKPHDLTLGSLSLVFAGFSIAWPQTGFTDVAGLRLERGYLMAAAYLAIAAVSLLFPLAAARLEAGSAARATAAAPGASETRESLGARAFAFVRIYYPQAFLAVFFTDAILLSSQALGGVAHDAFYAAMDKAIFGFQPSRQFSRILGSQAWINELMFGVYFAYFPLMIAALWIPFIKGNRAEGERQMFIVLATVAVVYVWYVFYRVEGPKYWLPDLHRAWYDGIEGGVFVKLFRSSLATTTLSGAAFPSTHVILTLTTLALAYRTDRRYFAIYLPIAVLILLSTVYIRAHWATDILGGIVVALLLPPFFYRLHGRADRLAARLSGGSVPGPATSPGRDDGRGRPPEWERQPD